MLHCLHLGIFKWVPDCLFDQLGKMSQSAKKIHGLAVTYGNLFQRQSQHSIMPKIKFSNGIIQGKLLAKEYEGILLLIATILCSTSGSNVLKDRKGTTFSTKDGIKDWVTLVETLLMCVQWLKSDKMLWVQWLKSDEMPKKLVKRSQKNISS
jgi:hypothetical protein